MVGHVRKHDLRNEPQKAVPCAQMAGDRAFHRIIPPDFRPLWVALGEEVPQLETLPDTCARCRLHAAQP